MTIVELSAAADDQTETLQQAIDAAAARGGGIVSLAAGRHLCGPLRLRGGITLEIQKNALLVLDANYDRLLPNTVSVVAEGSDRALIVAQGQHGVTIRGEGDIVAPGRTFVVGEDPEAGTHLPATLRPRVLVVEDCTDVNIEGVRIVDSPMWTVHLVGCANVRVCNLRIDNDLRLPNTDGIVVDSCRDVEIEGVDISTADDGVCLKTTRRTTGIGRIANVSVRRCKVRSRSCALKVGTETFGDITGVVFEDCDVVDSNRALGIFSRDGGAISGVRFSRIAVECHETPIGFWGSGEAITVTSVDRRSELPAGQVSNVVFNDISGSMEGAINLVGTGAAGIHDIRLDRVELTQSPGQLGTARSYDLRPTAADLALNPGNRGRANAWSKDSTGQVVGLVAYPTGLPAVFARGVTGLMMNAIQIRRPQPSPEGWARDLFDLQQ